MHRSIFAAVLLSTFAPAFAEPAAPLADPATLLAWAEGELAKAYPADGPGAAVLVRFRGETLLRKGYGMANLDLGVPITPEQVFEIGSVTKQFTAASVLKLAEQGKLSLDDPIQKFLPDFPTGGATVTLTHLLQHTGGIPSYTDMKEWLPRWREDMSLDTLIGLFRGKPLEFPPGSMWSYSNSGYVLLGAVIEKASGRSYEEFVESEIFAPLGMKDSRFGHQEEVVRGRVTGYHRGSNGIENAPYLSLTQPYAAGSLMSTVDDLARWSDALESGRVVTPASRDRMFTPARLVGGEQDGVDTGYGFGNGTLEIGGRAVHAHSGGIHGFSAYLLRVGEPDLLVVLLSNLPEVETSPLVFGIARKALGVATGPPATDVAAVPESALDDYVGVYLVPGRPDERRYIRRDGASLTLQRTGGDLQKLRPIGRDRFGFEEGDAIVQFARDGRGKVAHLAVDRGIGPALRSRRTGEPLPAARIAVAVDPSALPGLAGVYALAPGFDITVTVESGRLWAQATGQDKLELHAASPDRWFMKEVDAEIEFVRDAAGSARSIVLHQGGEDLPAPRKP